MDVLRSKVAIVTGAANGIGEAIALEFAGEGAAVVLSDINYDRAREVAARITAFGRIAKPIKTDVTDQTSVSAMVREVAEHFSEFHILVNNAGIYPRYIWHEMTMEQWDHTHAVNLKGCFICSRAVSPHFRQRREGKIINVGSVAFWLGQPNNLVHYIASKGGVIGLTRALAREVGEFNVQVNVITPGAVETEEAKKITTAEMAQAVLAQAVLAQQCLARISILKMKRRPSAKLQRQY